MSTTLDQLPDAGDEVLCTVRDPKMPERAWIEFASGKRVEVPIWIERGDDVSEIAEGNP